MRPTDLSFYPTLLTDNPRVYRAYRIALGDLLGNVQPFRDGLLESKQPVILAGLDYDTPWTRALFLDRRGRRGGSAGTIRLFQGSSAEGSNYVDRKYQA